METVSGEVVGGYRAEIAPTPKTGTTLTTGDVHTVDPLLASVLALPLPDDGADERWNLRTATAAWLAGRKSAHTRRAYFRDVGSFLGWCDATGLDPRDARRADIDAFTVARCANLSPSSTARRLSVVSSWFDYLLSNEICERNPVAAVDRPSLDRDASPTVGLTAAEVGLLLATARRRRTANARRDALVLALLATLGARVGEVIGADVEHLGHDRGHRVLTLVGKGNKRRRLPIPPAVGHDLDRYLAERAEVTGVAVEEISGPLLVTATGKRLDQQSIDRLVRRVAREADIASADKISAHSLRHSMITTALDNGATLRDVQDAAGHADPRTTRRYDRSRGNLDRSPIYGVSAAFSVEDADL